MKGERCEGTISEKTGWREVYGAVVRIIVRNQCVGCLWIQSSCTLSQYGELQLDLKIVQGVIACSVRRNWAEVIKYRSDHRYKQGFFRLTPVRPGQSNQN